MESPDYYSILGISKDATQDDIRKSFRKLAKKYHPDVAKDKDTAETKFKEINEAYEVLGDPEKRKKYDLYGNQPEAFQSDAPWGGYQDSGQAANYQYSYEGTGFSDFFEQMFGARANAAGSSYSDFQQHATQRRGRDTHADILVGLGEVMHGAERSLQLQQVNRSNGAVETKSHRIRIPKGISEDQLIRCAGLGEPGVNGGPEGDLFLHVRFEKHPDFRVIGPDLHCDLPVAPWEAVLGAEVPVRALDGTVRIKIPPNSGEGTGFRIKSRGLPIGTDGTRGNLVAELRIMIPPSATEDELELWEKLATTSSFNPR